MGPAGPAGPVAPATPATPAAPAGPVAPVGPGAPAGPVAPAGPADPVGPVAPVSPLSPLSPLGPTEASGLQRPKVPVASWHTIVVPEAGVAGRPGRRTLPAGSTCNAGAPGAEWMATPFPAAGVNVMSAAPAGAVAMPTQRTRKEEKGICRGMRSDREGKGLVGSMWLCLCRCPAPPARQCEHDRRKQSQRPGAQRGHWHGRSAATQRDGACRAGQEAAGAGDTQHLAVAGVHGAGGRPLPRQFHTASVQGQRRPCRCRDIACRYQSAAGAQR